MLTSIYFLSLISIALAQRGYYFVLGSGQSLTYERIDPAIQPGSSPSQHVHSVVGGNGFASSMNFAQTQTSNCSTVEPIADKSNYWMPNLYFQDPSDGSFTRVPEQPYHKIYYKYGNGSNQQDTDITEFPPEFIMIGGDATARSYNNSAMGPYGSGLGWFCHGNRTVPDIKDAGIPRGFTSCPNGLAASLTMPSCWNGKPFNPSAPHAHMAYPVADGIGGCPAGFRAARFPQIFVEYWFDVHTFNGRYKSTDRPFVLSFGDKTGYGFHIDFINGWPKGILNAAMKTCIPGNTGSPPLSDPTCFGGSRGGVYTSQQMTACMLKPTVNENIGWTYPIPDGPKVQGGKLSKLPGCQTIMDGPGPVTLQTCA